MIMADCSCNDLIMPTKDFWEHVLSWLSSHRCLVCEIERLWRNDHGWHQLAAAVLASLTLQLNSKTFPVMNLRSKMTNSWDRVVVTKWSWLTAAVITLLCSQKTSKNMFWHDFLLSDALFVRYRGCDEMIMADISCGDLYGPKIEF